MTILNRGEIAGLNDQINLLITFKDMSGNPVNTDAFPTISIVQPSGLVFLAPTSMGVSRISTGTYSYIFTVPYAASLGIWNDVWAGFVNGFRIEQTFSFAILNTQTPAVPSDNFNHLGEDNGFHYSQCAIRNINKLIKSVRARLNSSGKAKSTDGYGNVQYVSCDIFSVDMLTTFLATALWEFNQIPYFTFYTFDEDCFVDQFGEILVEGAVLWALASQALIERGREYQITDNGINFNPPTVSELLETQYSAGLSMHLDKLKYIKNSIRPHPRGLGRFDMNSGTLNPALRQMRNFRARRIF